MSRFDTTGSGHIPVGGPIRPTPEQRAEMAEYIEKTSPGLLDDLGIDAQNADQIRRLAEWWSWTQRGQPVHAHSPTEASENRCGLCGFYSDDVLHRKQHDD